MCLSLCVCACVCACLCLCVCVSVCVDVSLDLCLCVCLCWCGCVESVPVHVCVSVSGWVLEEKNGVLGRNSCFFFGKPEKSKFVSCEPAVVESD